MQQTAGRPNSEMERTLVDFLQSRARRYGSRDALLFKPGFRYLRWSYSRLWNESGKVASLLQSRGLSKGDQVLLWGPNSPQWVLAFFGCVRAGAVVVPLDLRSAPDYVGRVIDRAAPRLAFTSRYTPKGDADLGVPEITFEELESAIYDLPEPEPVNIEPDDLVEIMFTSGTTGDPKGVMLTHRNLTANIEGITQYIACDTSSRLLSILPLSHMYEQMGGLLAVLHFGASVTYPTSRQPAVLARTMRERRVTTLLLVPQGLELLMNGIEREVRNQGKEALWGKLMKLAERTPFRLRRYLFGRVHRRFGGRLDFIVSGGAALDPDLGRKWELMGVKIVQGYGATEASPVISNHTLEDRRPGSVGRPLPNVEVVISSEGEILARGENISPGYYNAPDQTEAAFVDGWYRTGDLGHFDDEGFLHIRGRLKDMIVLPSGQNVYPDDIQAVLNRHPGVTDSSVVGLPRAGSVEVHAALILEDSHDPEAIVAWANAQLAEQQHVRGFTVWPEEDFPRTHTLKVKKPVLIEALNEIAATGSFRTATPTSTARQTPTSGRRRDGVPSLAEIIAEVAPVEAEEIGHNMTLGNDLGLDSLGRVELLSAVETHLGIFVDESQVDSETTVDRLQRILDEGAANPVMNRFPAWGMRWWCRMARGFLQRTMLFPAVLAPYSLSVHGQERLRGVEGPVLFASNHNLGLDNPLIIKAIPQTWRRRLAIAAAAKLWRNPVRSVLNPLLGNGFPLAQDGPIRPSLENMGRILDSGWSVLIYPEGKLTVGGPILPFKNGTGLVAVEGRLPVVPMKLQIKRFGSPAKYPILRRGSVEIRFGEPMVFPPRTAYQDATDAIEEAVRAL
ncbi:MAG: AMP-binding protein [Chloroflexota bacterium]|nr:AMP-binding protein [Chloroflexota bacterium]MDE2941704.1 AMP-binding protein [Chloroflexota bacterium]MDE3267154.1 AMP-binding protein [Chloroflexota bacterium]